jgi:hypothetical protein
MKSATGYYYNLFSENKYDNYGLENKFDIMIIFIESFGEDDMSDIFESLELYIEMKLREVGVTNASADENVIRKVVIGSLEALDYEYERVIVTKI